MDNCKTEPECREEKHISLNHQIISMDEVRQELQELLDRISGEDRSKEVPGTLTDAPHPSFLQVLDHAPDRLCGVRSECTALIEEIRIRLF